MTGHRAQLPVDRTLAVDQLLGRERAFQIVGRQALRRVEPADLLGDATDQFGLKADGVADVRLRIRLIGQTITGSPQVDVSALSWRCVRPGSSSTYARLSGTSMASPQVAGVAGLLKSAEPALTTAQLRAALLSTVTPTASLAGRTRART